MRYELSDYEWTAIEPMLPNKPRGFGWLERAAKVRDSGDVASRRDAAGSAIRLPRVGIRAALGVSIRTAPEHPIVAGFHAGAAIFAVPGEAEFQKFAHGRGPRRHAVLETEIIQGGQLLRRQHHLEPFVANVVHGKYPDLAT